MNSLAKFAVGSLALILSHLTYAQQPSPLTASQSSAVVSDTQHDIKPEQPATPDISTDTDADIVADPASLLPDLPPLPRANATLIGGTVEHLDRVRDQLTVRVFGGGRTNILFDPRTRVYREGEETTLANLHDGDRVSIDTTLDGATVFARSIRMKTAQAQGESQGVVLKYESERSELTVRDAISPEPVRLQLDDATRFLQGGRAVSASLLTAGSLVAVQFNSEGNVRDVAREISILALPGTRYTFAGQVMHLDLRTGLLVLNSSTDHKTYEIYLEPSADPNDSLHVGTVVTVVTNFEGSRYVAHNLTINSQGK